MHRAHSERLDAEDDDAEEADADGAAEAGDIAPVLPNMREAITAQLLHLSKLGIIIQHAPKWPSAPRAVLGWTAVLTGIDVEGQLWLSSLVTLAVQPACVYCFMLAYGRFIYHAEGVRKNDARVRRVYAALAQAADGSAERFRARHLESGAPFARTLVLTILVSLVGFAALLVPSLVLSGLSDALRTCLFQLAFVWLAFRALRFAHWMAGRACASRRPRAARCLAASLAHARHSPCAPSLPPPPHWQTSARSRTHSDRGTRRRSASGGSR